jgi:hypothetical protein
LNQAPLGGTIGAGMDNQESNDKEVTITRCTVSLLETFERFNVPKEIDCFSLNVEVAESLILSTFPLDSCSFKILTIERPKDDAKSLLISYGCVCLKKLATWGETLWAKRSAIPGLDLKSMGLSQEVVMAPSLHAHCQRTIPRLQGEIHWCAKKDIHNTCDNEVFCVKHR